MSWFPAVLYVEATNLKTIKPHWSRALEEGLKGYNPPHNSAPLSAKQCLPIWMDYPLEL